MLALYKKSSSFSYMFPNLNKLLPFPIPAQSSGTRECDQYCSQKNSLDGSGKYVALYCFLVSPAVPSLPKPCYDLAKYLMHISFSELFNISTHYYMMFLSANCSYSGQQKILDRLIQMCSASL